jgi:hypothetical protein
MKTFVIAAKLTTLMVFLLISSCAIAPMKGYVGPDLPSDKMAIIENGVYVDIEKYDGINLGFFQNSVAVLPGNHTIEVAFRNQLFESFVLYSEHTAMVKFVAKAGHTYVVYAHVTGYYEWQARVIDKKSGDQITNSETLPLIREWIHTTF